MKKLNITLFTLVSALFLMFGVFSMSNVNLASADNTVGATPVLSETKVAISNNNDKMLLVTAIKNKADVYEVGYTFTGEVTTTSNVNNKYYTSITNDTTSITATDLFGSDWSDADVGMIIWEIEFALGTSYEYKAYAKVGERNGSGNLVLPETEVVVTPVDATSKTFYTVAFDTDGGNAIATELVLAGTSADELANFIPEKDGYDFVKWQLNGVDIPAGATVQQNITVKAVWSAKTYTATFMADGDTVATKIYNHGATELDQEPEVPFKAGFVGAWESYELAVGGVTINAVYTAVDYNNYPTYSASVEFDMRDTTPFDVDLPSEIAEYTVVSSRLTSYGDGTMNAAVTNNNDGTVNVPKSVPNRGENTISVRMVDETTRSYATLNIALIKADMIIKTADEFKLLGEDMQKAQTGNKYYILGADIDYSTVTGATADSTLTGCAKWDYGWTTAYTFAGRFDGRGHTLKNFGIRMGIFGILSGTVKNVLFENPIAGTYTGGVICYASTGTIENCAVITNVVSGETTKFAPITWKNKGVIKNCVVNITEFVPSTNPTYAGDNCNALSALVEDNWSFTNCYAVSTCSNYMYDTNTDGLFASTTDFFTNVTELSKDNDWSSYWKIENGALYFNNVQVL